MKIFVDENIPATTVTELREQGHDVLDIRGTKDQGMPDQELWQKAIEQKRLLITTDKGFSEHREDRLRYFDHSPQTTLQSQNPSTCYAGTKAIYNRPMAGTDGCNA